MSLLRLVITWLVMAALPLQGLAAASMLFCDQAAHSTVVQQGEHDHAAHSDGGDHKHDPGQADSQLDQQHDAGQQDSAAAVDDGHACPICASCCNMVALSETPTLSLAAGAPQSAPLEGPSRVITRDSPTPDKPPRA